MRSAVIPAKMLSSSLMLRRFCCLTTATSSPAASAAISSRDLTSRKKRLVYLGSPQVSLSLSLSQTMRV